MRECLPEGRRKKERSGWGRDGEDRERPSPEMNIKDMREELSSLEFRRRKLNAAIQKANCNHQIALHEERMSLGEALEARKTLNERIGEYHAQVMTSAYTRVIYKEDRDIVEESSISFRESFDQLERARLEFRCLNRSIRRASFEACVVFRDEE